MEELGFEAFGQRLESGRAALECSIVNRDDDR
jgi:hypothetical protein